MVNLNAEAPEASHANGTQREGLYRLQCKAQTYAWGLPAEESEVARMCRAGGQTLDPSAPYAELWMGTHPSGPSTLDSLTGPSLLDLLQRRPELLGAAAARFGPGPLPFLFKVLSIGSALSIQSHPDKALAEQLHAARPDAYPDANHKPEMVLALTRCEALCGFVPHETLVATLHAVPELRQAVGEASAAGYEASAPGAGRAAALRALLSSLVTAPESQLGDHVDGLASRLRSIPAPQRTQQEALLLCLAAQYPRDVGVLAALLLNHVRLEPGEGLALAANVPHAYLAGQALEAMAASDNVIRMGLTPKLRDATVLCESLTYEQGIPAILRGVSVPTGGEAKATSLRLYRPTVPFPEFEAYFLAAGSGLELHVVDEEGELQLAAASCNGMGFGTFSS